MDCYTEWEYVVAKDDFHIYFPEGDYDIVTLAEWYKIIPTNSEKIGYYGDNETLLKQHFEKFSKFEEVWTKSTNDFHSNSILYVHCMVIYNSENDLVGFAAQELIEGKPADKKILYFNKLRDNY